MEISLRCEKMRFLSFEELQELNFNEEIINDRQKDVNDIEGMVYNLRDLMVDASKEISKQGVMVGNLILILLQY